MTFCVTVHGHWQRRELFVLEIGGYRTGDGMEFSFSLDHQPIYIAGRYHP